MAKIFVYNANGDIVETKEKGRGRPPKNSTTDVDGNIHVRPAPEAFKPLYITLLADGTVIKEEKGRGCPRKEFPLADDGDFKGHFVKNEIVAAFTAV